MRCLSINLLASTMLLAVVTRAQDSTGSVVPLSWVDSVYQSMSEDERIAQLFMVAAYSDRDSNHVKEIEELVQEQHIGGLIFFQGGPVRQARLTNHYQKLAKTPLLISMDAEWGLGMRLDSTISYPRQMQLGAISDDTLLYFMGRDVADQCRRLGIHLNLAPVVDINSNPDNPVINSRSFGEVKNKVAHKGLMYMKGMQDNGILACAKHFPGHGDTDVDSHKALPVIKHTARQLEATELYPFRQLMDAGLASVMIAHLYIPALDSTPYLASTLSKPIVSGLLRRQLGYDGLVITDALNMKGVSSYYKPGAVDLMALEAGNDILLFSEDVPTAVAKIKAAISDGSLNEKAVEEHCKRILRAKYKAGLNHYHPVELHHLTEDLNDARYEALRHRMNMASLTLLKNKDSLLPVTHLDTLSIASVAIGAKEGNIFQERLKQYADVTTFTIDKKPSEVEKQKLIKDLAPYDLVIISIHGDKRSPSSHFGIPPETAALAKALRYKHKCVLDIFANPYALSFFDDILNNDAVIMSYHDGLLQQSYSAQLIFGGMAAKGHLPVSAGHLFKEGDGLETKAPIRLSYGIPELAGLSTEKLKKVDSLVYNAITEQACPGAQLVVARHGMVVYNKSFGYHTYEEKRPVKNDDLYDLASVTKISATLPSVMMLQDSGKMDLDHNLCDYIPELVDTTDYMNLNLREILAHQAGLISWIPFYQKTLEKGRPSEKYYRHEPGYGFNVQVADHLYIRDDYPDIIIQRILKTRLRKPGEYKYSDLGYYLMKEIVEKESGTPLNVLAAQSFYKPMGMTTTGYLPLKRFPVDRIAPTEYDMTFRKQLIHGYVHDPGAAMQGGVGGHAGNFSCANDMAKLMQMYLNGGTYGGRRYLSAATLHEYTNCQFCSEDNRRGAGFDKPVRGEGPGPTFNGISYDSFGHSGFTGILVWADPDEDIVYIFLSNRVYPDAGNKKLIKMGVRTEIMKAIYESINR